MKELVRHTSGSVSQINTLDMQLKNYYSENFMTVESVPLQVKSDFMRQLKTQNKSINSFRQIFGYLSAAVFIGIASYTSVDCHVDIKLIRHMQIVE